MNFLITGASSGLGLFLCSKLSYINSAKVYGTYNKNPPEGLTDAIYYKSDFSSKTDLVRFIKEINSLNIDVLVNNFHPGYEFEHSHNLNPSKLINSFKNYLFPTITLTNDLIKSFRKRRFGIIINILSSVTISDPPNGQSLYTAEKRYLESFNYSWHIENNKLGVYSIAISPGIMDTNIHRNLDPRLKEMLLTSNSLTKMDNIINEIIKIINDPEKYTGRNILVK